MSHSKNIKPYKLES